MAEKERNQRNANGGEDQSNRLVPGLGEPRQAFVIDGLRNTARIVPEIRTRIPSAREHLSDGISPRPEGLFRALCFDSCTVRLLLFQTPDEAFFRYESYSEDWGWTAEYEQGWASVREMVAGLAEWEDGVQMEEIDLQDGNAV